MLVGVALLSVVTANIAAFFVESEEVDLDALDVRLARIEQLLEQRRERDAIADPHGTQEGHL